MRLPPGKRSRMMASSSMAASASASSQRASRWSRSASTGARSSVWPCISTPRLNSQDPWRRDRPSALTGGGGGTRSPANSWPTTSPVAGLNTRRQACTGTLRCAKPGRTSTTQPAARKRGTWSAQKSAKESSCTRVHSGRGAACARSSLRHCSTPSGRGNKPSDRNTLPASASAARSRSSSTAWPCWPGTDSVGAAATASASAGAAVSQTTPARVL